MSLQHYMQEYSAFLYYKPSSRDFSIKSQCAPSCIVRNPGTLDKYSRNCTTEIRTAPV